METTPPYEEAVTAFKKFLEKEGWSQTIVWRRPDDVVHRVEQNMVVRRRSSEKAAEWARRYYESGYSRGLGICLSAECEIDGAVYATIFWTADDQEAESRMMPAQGLKLSGRLPRTCGKSVSWLEWWFWKKRLEILHKAIAAEFAHMRENESRGADSSTDRHD
jgi:hypothetical protein